MTAPTVARIAPGLLQGKPEGGIIAFRGVPYAAPPTGARRFAAPVPFPTWTGTRDATRDGPIAPQPPSRLRDAMGDFSAPQDEDCLTLTIWTPGVDDARRPVLVWLHGGAWSSGAGSLPWYDGARLAREQGIVVVGVNYRLGALGYLHAPGISPGNLGSLDEIAALEWVRDNVASVGGDAARVTVAGQSAGASSIGRLMLDPRASRLFQRAILQSGSFGRPPLSRDEAAGIGAQFVRLLGIDPAAADAAARMRTVPVADLIAASGALARARARFGDTTPSFMPHVETAIDQAGLIAAIAEAARGMDVLIGTTREEVHAFYAANPAMAAPPDEAVRARFAELAGDAGAIAAYRRRRPGATVMDLLADLGSDHTFTWPSLRLAEALAARGVGVHAYQFDWAPPQSRFRACHCIELPFMFGTLDAWPDAAMLAGGDAAQMEALSLAMRTHWGRFVRDGAAGLDWPDYDRERRMTMVYGDVCGPVGDPAAIGERA